MNTIKLLRARGIDYSVPDSPDYSFTADDIVYTDSYEVFNTVKDRVYKVFYDPSGSRYVLEKAVLAVKDKEVYNQLSIGIDPGGRYTVIALADGEPVDWRHVSDINDLVEYVNELLIDIPAKEKIVRVGVCGRGVEIAYMISKATEDRACVELVDEKHSTPHGYRNPFIERILSNIRSNIDNNMARKRDLYAAITIALKEGVMVDKNVKGGGG